MDRIGVFCSSSEVLSESVIQATQELGAWIGSHKKMLVYGGVNKGLMEVIACAVKQHGGRVMGILPQAFACPERQSQYVDIEVPVSHLCDRKATLMRESDVFIVLPGGIGTLDVLRLGRPSSRRASQASDAFQSRWMLESTHSGIAGIGRSTLHSFRLHPEHRMY